jgi:hypothetical protein
MRESLKHIERLNIPVSNSLLHKQEYNNTIIRLHTEKRRAASEKRTEKNTNKMVDGYDNILRLHSYRTEHIKC